MWKVPREGKKLYYPFLTSLPGGKRSVIQRKSRELVLNSSKCLNNFCRLVIFDTERARVGGGGGGGVKLLKGVNVI